MSTPFISIEALDGAGKTTQTKLLTDHLRADGYTIHHYHFPQEDRATGRLIYDKFLFAQGGRRAPQSSASRHSGVGFSRREQALLYIQDFFSRLEEMEGQKSTPDKAVILTDRYCTSTMAYQTIGLAGQQRQEMLDWLIWLCWESTPRLLKPDVVFLLDIPVAESVKTLNGKTADYFENETKLTAIRDSYLQLAKEQGWNIINNMDKAGTRRSPEDIHQEVWHYVKDL